MCRFAVSSRGSGGRGGEAGGEIINKKQKGEKPHGACRIKCKTMSGEEVSTHGEGMIIWTTGAAIRERGKEREREREEFSRQISGSWPQSTVGGWWWVLL